MKIGMLTSGGDCQSLNAAMRGVAKNLYNNTNTWDLADIAPNPEIFFSPPVRFL